MKPASFWIIRLALTVQFLCVLSVPALLAATDAPRATWMAEWVNPRLEPALIESTGRAIGVLRLRDNRLTFTEQVGQAEWQLDVAAIRKVSTINGGRLLVIESVTGDEYTVRIIEANFAEGNPKRAKATLERAIEALAATNR